MLAACHCCGKVHRVPAIDQRSIACCVRCRSVIRHGAHPRSASRTAAYTLAALMIYPLALTLPVMQIERLGHINEASIWSGMVGLLAEGHVFVGLIVLLFSVVAPVGKLGMLMMLCVGRRGLEKRDRASVYKLVEFIELSERRISDIYENTEMDKGRKVAQIQQIRRWINIRQDRLDIADELMDSRTS